MGPTYFVQLRRVQVFGVRIDGVSRQMNYAIDEDQTIGQDGTSTNGPNAVISMLDHALTENGFGEEIEYSRTHKMSCRQWVCTHSETFPKVRC